MSKTSLRCQADIIKRLDVKWVRKLRRRQAKQAPELSRPVQLRRGRAVDLYASPKPSWAYGRSEFQPDRDRPRSAVVLPGHKVGPKDWTPPRVDESPADPYAGIKEARNPWDGAIDI